MEDRMMENLLETYPELETCKKQISQALELVVDTYKNKGKILVCGNGGSASDSEHIVGELMKGFLIPRKVLDERISEEFRDKLQGGLPAISLCSQTSLISAYANDVDPDMVYAQQVYGYGTKQDLLIGLSTSGNSKNVVNAVKVANQIGMKTIGMTGKGRGKLNDCASVTIAVPAVDTYRVQEYHLPIYHYLCGKTEEIFFG